MVVITVTLVIVSSQPADPGKWNSTQANDTEDLAMGAIGLAPNRGNTGNAIDKTGKLKPKWCILNYSCLRDDKASSFVQFLIISLVFYRG